MFFSIVKCYCRASTTILTILHLHQIFFRFQAVILHTDRAIDLLKRRKVKKELLFRYLHEKHVSIEASAAKSAHVIRVLEVWDSRDTVDSIDIVEDCSLDAPPPAPVPSRNASHTSLCSLDLSRDSFPVNPNRMDSTELRRADSAASIMNCDDQSVNFTASSVPLGSQLSASTSHPQCQEMANNFVKWYFDMLNAAVMSSQTEFGPSHFWPDASAKVELLGVNGEPLESLQVEKNATEVCLMLVNVLKRHALHCNPNLCEEGVRGRLDPHGLVLVLACGTLHNQHTVCGVFEQVGTVYFSTYLEKVYSVHGLMFQNESLKDSLRE